MATASISVSGQGLRYRQPIRKLVYSIRNRRLMVRMTHLLDGLSRENERALWLHAYTVLNTDAHTAEVIRPSFIIRDVDAPAMTRQHTKSRDDQRRNKTYGSTVMH